MTIRNWVWRFHRFGRPCGIAQRYINNTEGTLKVIGIDGGGENVTPVVARYILPAYCGQVDDIAGDGQNNRVGNLT